MAEILLGLDPSATTYPDSDNDGLNDIEEFKLGTDPFNPSPDGDGLLDGEEVAGRAMTNTYAYFMAQSNPQYHYTAIYDDNGDFVDLAYEAIYPDPQEAAARL